MNEKKEEKNDIKYIGVRRAKTGGRVYFRAEICVNRELIPLGMYHEPKVAAKAYDLYVIKHGLNRKTNFLKKKVG